MNYDLSKIRIKCAEIVGWAILYCKYHNTKTWHSPFGICGEGTSECVPPNVTESADAALELVAWMAKPENGGWWPTATHEFPNRKWLFTFSCTETDAHGEADTFALALCLAFLKANNINPEML